MSKTNKNIIQEAYIRSQVECDKAQTNLLKFIRPGKKIPEGGFALMLDESAGEAVKAVEAAEKHLNAVQKDMDHYEKLLGAEGSMEAIMNGMARSQRVISESDFAARKATENAIKTHAGLDVRACEELPAIAELIRKRDHAKETYSPQVDALKDRVSKIRALESKYSSEN